jgi:predicted  nucleic acid-binding Zn-ribbon protein
MSDADTNPFRLLLDLQHIDTTIIQLHHRRANLSERVELQHAREAIARLDAELEPFRATLADLAGRQHALEVDVAALETRIADADRRLFSGVTTAPRELQALQADVASLKKHRSELEDAELEIMISRDPIDAQVALGIEQRERLVADEVRLVAAVAHAEADIDAAAGEASDDRASRAAAVMPDLLALYEKVRRSNKGVGVARLEHGTCMACRLKLPAVELDRLHHQPADAVVRCDACGTILVR